MSWIKRAVEKLDEQLKTLNGDRHIGVMKKPVHDALVNFCNQNEEFAQAVVEGGSFEDCMTAVAKNCGNGLSDLQAYERAVNFYFAGAKVHMELHIQLEPAEMESERGIVLNLADFF